MDTKDLAGLKKKFDEDGYVLVPSFLSQKEVEEIKTHTKYFIDNKLSALANTHVFYEDKSDLSTLKQIMDLNKHDDFFSKMLNGSRFERVAAALLDDEVIGKNIEYFNKPARIGKATPPHQDNYYFMLNPQKAVTMWLALENVDEENGCVRYIRGSHLMGLRPHGRTQTLGFSQGITDYGEEDFARETPFPALPGDLLIHHSMTIHRADGNTSSTRTRKAIGFIYFGKSAKEDTEAKKAYQEKLKADMVEQGKI